VSGAIDIVVNPWTPLEVANNQVGVDEHFYDKVGVAAEHRGGTEIDDYVALMDAAGIAASLLVAVRAGDMRVRHSYAIPYDRVAGYCAAHSGRLFGLAGIDASRITHGLRELEHGVREFGFVGAHLYPHWFGWAPDDARYYPFYAKCCELDIPIMLQVGHCLDYRRDRILASVGRPMTLDRVAIDFPDLRLIGIHLGWPWVDEMIAVAYKHANVFMAGDAYGPKHWPADYVHFANTWGREKCLFGTDWPVVHPVRAVREIEELGLREESKAKLYRENALRVFKLADRIAQ